EQFQSGNLFQQPASISDLRAIISTAQQEGKLPLSENNINRLLTDSKGKYAEIAADVPKWLSDNFSLPGHHSQVIQTLTPDHINVIKNAAVTADKTGKTMTLKLKQEEQQQQADAAKGSNFFDKFVGRASSEDAVDKAQSDIQLNITTKL